MSAIFGIHYLEGRPVDRTDLERMLESLAHRGSDGVGLWSEGSVGLGNRMLWTTPESLQEKLPLLNQSGDLVLTADARIDNRDELLAVLDLTDCPPEQITDSQLILAAYEKWGEHCTERLLGDFAFALWDGRRQTLFCGRDHFGVKPFYYYCSESIFAFATEIKALLCLPAVPRRLNEVRVGDHLASMNEDTGITFYQDILRLAPRHSITVNHQGSRLQCYWSLDSSRELRLSSDQEYAERFRELFTEAVRCRLRSAFPVGSMLSGGLDSSSVTCTARKLLAQNGAGPLPTFSAIFDEVVQCDERPFINAVLAQENLEPHFIHGDQLGPLSALNYPIWYEDEAVNAPNLFLTWNLYTAARERRIRILLDGFDGDTVVSHGVMYMTELARAKRWITLSNEVRSFGRNFNLSPWTMIRNYAWRYGIHPLIPVSLRRAGRPLLRLTSHRSNGSPSRPRWCAAMNPDFVRRIGLVERRRFLLKSRPESQQTEREHHYTSLTWGVMPWTLEVLDRAAAAFSIEPRFPFWDKRLAEYCLSLPPEQKMHRGWTRMVLRRAMAGILPVEVQWRRDKSNLGPNFERGLRNIDGRLLDDVILKNPEAIERYMNMSTLCKAYGGFVSQAPHQVTDDDTLTCWKAATLALWLRQSCLSS